MSQELQDWLRGASFRMKRDLAGKIKAQADRLAGAIKAAAPVRTGRLRDSIKVRRTRNDLKFYVTGGGFDTSLDVRKGSGVEYDYARALEFGTSKMPAQPFFYPTARALADDIRSEIEQAVAEALGK